MKATFAALHSAVPGILIPAARHPYPAPGPKTWDGRGAHETIADGLISPHGLSPMLLALASLQISPPLPVLR